MADWKKLINKIAVNAEEQFDKAKYKIKERFDLFNPIQIVVYNSYGTADMLHIKGRVLEDKNIARPKETDGMLENIWNMYRRLESDEIPGAVLEIKFQGTPHIVASDEEGYFELALAPHQRISYRGDQHQVEVTLKSAPIRFDQPVKVTGTIFMPPPGAQYGIISDIDDTIIETGATDMLRMIRSTFTGNALTRLPFKGAHAFYRALQRGISGSNDNPFFYVSSSPWNLYDFLIDFMKVNDFPEAPLLLRDVGVDRRRFFSGSHHDHKYGQITRVLATYPDLQFILIGDSGQEDASIYRKVAEDFPGRILAIYIRDVQLPDRATIVKDIFAGYSQKHTPMLLVENTVAAAEHAVKRGFIPESALAAIRGEKALAVSSQQ